VSKAGGAAEPRDDRCVRLLQEHDRALRRLAASYERDPSKQQDLIQDIWLGVWQALPRFRGECSERTFVFRIAHNRAVSHVDHWQRRRTDLLDEDAPVATSQPDQSANRAASNVAASAARAAVLRTVMPASLAAAGPSRRPRLPST
jgi:RNA polymerase sigma-70 factor (ECF subfamily)